MFGFGVERASGVQRGIETAHSVKKTKQAEPRAFAAIGPPEQMGSDPLSSHVGTPLHGGMGCWKQFGSKKTHTHTHTRTHSTKSVYEGSAVET